MFLWGKPRQYCIERRPLSLKRRDAAFKKGLGNVVVVVVVAAAAV